MLDSIRLATLVVVLSSLATVGCGSDSASSGGSGGGGDGGKVDGGSSSTGGGGGDGGSGGMPVPVDTICVQISSLKEFCVTGIGGVTSNQVERTFGYNQLLYIGDPNNPSSDPVASCTTTPKTGCDMYKVPVSGFEKGPYVTNYDLSFSVPLSAAAPFTGSKGNATFDVLGQLCGDSSNPACGGSGPCTEPSSVTVNWKETVDGRAIGEVVYDGMKPGVGLAGTPAETALKAVCTTVKLRFNTKL